MTWSAVLRCAVLALLLGAGTGMTAQAETVIIPFGSCGWKYLLNPAGPEAPYSALSVDDHLWADGCAPFIAPWGCASSGTAIPEGRMIFRRHIFNPGPPAIAHYFVTARSTEAPLRGTGQPSI